MPRNITILKCLHTLCRIAEEITVLKNSLLDIFFSRGSLLRCDLNTSQEKKSTLNSSAVHL